MLLPSSALSAAESAAPASHAVRVAFEGPLRGCLALRKLLWKNNVLVHAHDVGGWQTSRTMRLDLATGEITVRANGRLTNL